VLSLDEIAAHPDLAARTFRTEPRGRAILRPFQLGDEDVLIDFFDGLSEGTRHRYGITDPGETVAQEWAQSIGLYDKLRMVLQRLPGRRDAPSEAREFGIPIAGVVEFSLDLTEADRERFARWGIPLRSGSALRFGICLADEEQGAGLASAAMPAVGDVVAGLGRRRIILWGGVLAENGTATAFYERNGFRTAGTWTDGRGRACRDMFVDVGDLG
jgi:GNAT superfamily N-acetyltransferase